MPPILGFESGKPTILDSSHIEEFGKHRGHIEGVKVVRVNEDHRLFLEGEFGGFRIYCLTTHARPEIIPESVRRISETHFIATLRLELAPNRVTEHEVAFLAPILPYRDVKAVAYGLYPDSFAFEGHNGGREIFICDLTFLTHYAKNSPPIPLNVRYVGIAKSQKREAQHRLGEGHEKLQRLLAEQVRRPGRQTVSIVLYRPSELDPPVISFPTVIETIEATMIQYFKPRPLNVQRIDFPNDSPDLLEKLRGIGAVGVMNKIESPRGTLLHSECVSASFLHQIIVPLS